MLIRGTLHLAVPLDACTGKPCPILDLLAFNPEFTTLVSLVKSADLVELLAKVLCHYPYNTSSSLLVEAIFRLLVLWLPLACN